LGPESLIFGQISKMVGSNYFNKYGFTLLPTRENQLFIPLWPIKGLVKTI